MSIIIEILDETTNAFGDKSYVVIKSKTIEVSQIVNTINIQKAKDRLSQIKSTLPPTQKIRVLEYHNDEFGNKNRLPCKILFEG